MNTLLQWRSCIRSTCCLRVALGAVLAHGLLECGNAYGQTSASPIHYVWASGGNVSPYTNWDNAATTIQAAVNAAHTNDTVLIRAGTYRGSGNRMILLNGKDLVLRAETDESPVIDCEDNADGIRLYFGSTTNTVIDGLTIVNSGGAINLSRSSATIRHCLITSNRYATGISASDASEVVIEDCVIIN
jgi:hypothetical protein